MMISNLKYQGIDGCPSAKYKEWHSLGLLAEIQNLQWSKLIFVAYLFWELYHHLSWYQSVGFCDGYLKAVYWCLVNISSSNKKYPASISNSKISDFRPTNVDGDDNNFVVMFWSSSDYHLIIIWSSSDYHLIIIWSSSDHHLIIITN